ncbi:MAG: putative DNA-binding protein [Frankiales bacterium]|nr:putative DNA-binding protein [Frankiales bacterium]
MRDLHVVAVSEDGRHVVLAGRPGAKTGGFQIALDERLAAAVRGELTRPGEELPGIALTPRDIQTRLRAGETAEDIAQAAGVPVARVLRFSGPVQGEMALVIEEARACRLVRGRLGASAVPLGEAVDDALAAGGAAPESVEWTTRRDEDGTWVVNVTWFARARVRSAGWRYDPVGKNVSANDPGSAALGHRDSDTPPVPRRRALPPPPKTPKPRKANKAQAKKAPAKKAPAKRAPAKKAVKKAAPAKKAPAKRAPAKKAAAKPSAKKAPAKKAARRRPAVAAPRPKRALSVVPDPPRRGRTKTAAVGSRASVPGWADVLLGTSPGGEH